MDPYRNIKHDIPYETYLCYVHHVYVYKSIHVNETIYDTIFKNKLNKMILG